MGSHLIEQLEELVGRPADDPVLVTPRLPIPLRFGCTEQIPDDQSEARVWCWTPDAQGTRIAASLQVLLDMVRTEWRGRGALTWKTSRLSELLEPMKRAQDETQFLTKAFRGATPEACMEERLGRQDVSSSD